MDPRGTVGRIHEKENYTTIHTKYESSWPCGFGEEDVLMFPHCKAMEANGPRGGDIFLPLGHDWQDSCKAPHNNAAY